MTTPFPPLAEQSCNVCRYHVDGQCRRHAPRVALNVTTGMADPAYRAVWPHTYLEDWCGEFCGREE